MIKPRIGVVIHTDLVARLFSDANRERLNGLGEVKWTHLMKSLSEADAMDLLADCEIGVGSWNTPWPSSRIVDACPRLRLWEHVAGSVKGMFGPHLKAGNLIIASCAPAIAESVAEFTLGELIVGLKRIIPNAMDNRRARAAKPDHCAVIGSSTIGVVAASLVGRRVIRMLKPFNPRILLFDPFVSSEEATELGVEKVEDLTRLCAESDAVTLHTPNTPQCGAIMGAEQFQAMADHAVFINTSRGACIDEAALIAELEKGRFFAFLDVTEPEPAADISPLRSLPNVMLTSHIAGNAEFNMGRQAVDDIEAFIQGRMPLRIVTEDMLDHIA